MVVIFGRWVRAAFRTFTRRTRRRRRTAHAHIRQHSLTTTTKTFDGCVNDAKPPNHPTTFPGRDRNTHTRTHAHKMILHRHQRAPHTKQDAHNDERVPTAPVLYRKRTANSNTTFRNSAKAKHRARDSQPCVRLFNRAAHLACMRVSQAYHRSARRTDASETFAAQIYEFFHLHRQRRQRRQRNDDNGDGGDDPII